MIETPVSRQLVEMGQRMKAQEDIEDVISVRFGKLSDDARARLEGLTDSAKLRDLHRFAVIAPSLEAFVERLNKDTTPPPKPTSSRRKRKT